MGSTTRSPRCMTRRASATFLAEVLGLEPPKSFGPAMIVKDANGLRLAYIDASPVGDQHGEGHGHYAFLVSEEESPSLAPARRSSENGLTISP